MPKRKGATNRSPVIDWATFERKGLERLKEIQPLLLPDKADHIVAIEPESGGYVVAKTRDEAYRQFHRRFPGKVALVIRADGGPVMRLRHKR
ncbi:MAG: hypothetical protein RRB24_12275 [Armatimonadota bacterium]|jgi:hypothetical protein|nr:hypothetical protein [Armatimonadota bacterium]MDT7973592.1 hypothetical protein [Armatimonadota bacterium]